MRKIVITLRILVGLSFLGSAIGKFTGGTDSVRDQLELAPWFWILVGAVELVGALALLASVWVMRLALPAGLLFVALMVGALVSHIRIGDPVSDMVAPAVLLLLSATISATAFWEDLALRDSLANRIAVSPDHVERRQTNV
jgi:putative oxidoreductase